LLAAFLIEFPFYLVPAFPRTRERLAPAHLPPYLFASAVLPYLAACCGASRFEWAGLARVAALALALALWFVVLPRRRIFDLAFLALFPVVLLGHYAEAVYRPLYPGLARELAVLSHVVLIQMTVTVLMLVRRVPETGYGFLPTLREWKIGAKNFVYFLAGGLPLAFVLGALRLRPHPAPAWSVAATFLGFLWVISLSEEFLVRGVLQGWLEEWTGRRNLALCAAAAVFGLVHLWFPTFPFPNWRWAIIAFLLGVCCGRARNQAGGIRAGMVTHALAVATWRAFFA
jgi:hypothetical protein